LMPTILFHSSSVVSRNGVLPPTPALFTRMSMRPKFCSNVLTIAATETGSATLTSMGTAHAPCALTTAAPIFAPSRLMSASATAAPSRASAFEIASPMPRAPPVTTACLPWSLTVSPAQAKSLYTAALYCTEKIRPPDLPTLECDFQSRERGIVGVRAAKGRSRCNGGDRSERIHPEGRSRMPRRIAPGYHRAGQPRFPQHAAENKTKSGADPSVDAFG